MYEREKVKGQLTWMMMHKLRGWGTMHGTPTISRGKSSHPSVGRERWVKIPRIETTHGLTITVVSRLMRFTIF